MSAVPHFASLDALIASDVFGSTSPGSRPPTVATVTIEGDAWEVPADCRHARLLDLQRYLAKGLPLLRHATAAGEPATDGRTDGLYLYLRASTPTARRSVHPTDFLCPECSCRRPLSQRTEGGLCVDCDGAR